MKRITAIILTGLVTVILCTAQTEPGTPSTFRQEGIASYYGSEFDGRSTASEELFDSTKFTAAHPDLPFGTMLIVTNTHNNRQVTVRVNDRGPFASARIIDVSRAAAEQLDMIVTGTAPVVIERAPDTAAPGPIPGGTQTAGPAPGGMAQPVGPIPGGTQATGPAPGGMAQPVGPIPGGTQATGPAPGGMAQPVGPIPGGTPQQTTGPAPQQAAPPGPTIPALIQSAPSFVVPAEIKPGIPPAGTNKRYRLQVGSYKVPRNATEVFNTLKRFGLNPAYEKPPGDEEIYRVVLPGLRPEEVPALANILGAAGFREALLREER